MTPSVRGVAAVLAPAALVATLLMAAELGPGKGAGTTGAGADLPATGARTEVRAPASGSTVSPDLSLPAAVSAGDVLFRVDQAVVTAPADGEVVEVRARSGTPVKAGDLVMVLRPSAAVAASGGVAAGPALPGTWQPAILSSGEYLVDSSFAGYRFGEQPLPELAATIDVTRFGALPDDARDDTEAIRSAVRAAARSSGRAVLRFPPGRFIVSDVIFIERGDIVLQGAGSGDGGTVLHVPRPLAEMVKTDEIRRREEDIAARELVAEGSSFSPFSWTGGVIWVRSPEPLAEAPSGMGLWGRRGQHSLRIAGAGRVRVGEILRVSWYNREGDDSSLLRHLYALGPRGFGDKVGQPSARAAITTQEVTVVAVQGDTLTLQQPLLLDVRPAWGAQISHTHFLTGVGIERLALEFTAAPPAPHHQERGYNAFCLNDLAHSWVRDVRVVNADSAFLVNRSANVTLRGLTVTGRPGHFGVNLLDVYGVLVEDFAVGEEIHSLSFDARARGSVFTGGRIHRPSFDLHRGPNHGNLFDDIVASEDRERTLVFDQTGQTYWGPAAGYNTYWNLRLRLSGQAGHAPFELGSLPEAGALRIVGVGANLPLHLAPAGAAHVEGIGAGELAIPSLYRHQLGQRLGRPAPEVHLLQSLQSLPAPSAETRWTVWGNGRLARNGKYYFAVGNHQIVDGNTLLMEYDPDTHQVTTVVDIARVLEQRPGQRGHGKVHADIVEDADGWLYFATWWGGRDPDREEPSYGPDYQGSILLRYQPETGEVENLGTIVPRHGVVTAVLDRSRRLIYFRAISYRRGKNEAGLAVFDIARKKVVFTGGGAEMGERRGLMLEADGGVSWSGPDLRLWRYDPLTSAIEATGASLPRVPYPTTFLRKNMLRAAAPPAPSGAVYGVTHGGMLFALDAGGGSPRALGTTWGRGYYATSLAVSPDGKRLYHAPFAPGPGDLPPLGEAPVVEVDLRTGQREALAILGPALAREHGYLVDQNYGVTLDARRGRLYLIYNGRLKATGAETPCLVSLATGRTGQ